MPIYEFKCLKCGQKVEILFRSSSDQVQMKCEACGADTLERIISASNFAVTGGGGGAKASGVQSTTRACSGGSCTTYDIPGPK